MTNYRIKIKHELNKPDEYQPQVNIQEVIQRITMDSWCNLINGENNVFYVSQLPIGDPYLTHEQYWDTKEKAVTIYLFDHIDYLNGFFYPLTCIIKRSPNLI